jgi:hypothetical protein
VDTDVEEGRIMDLMRKNGVFASGLAECKVLFCETVEGRIAVARQIEPALYVDDDPSAIKTLQRFLPSLLLLSDKEEDSVKMKEHPNVVVAKSLGEALDKMKHTVVPDED